MTEIREILPGSILWHAITDEATTEGFEFLARLAEKTARGENPFGEHGEVFVGVFTQSELIAVGGITRDPYTQDEEIGRLRHLYVRRPWRGRGVGRALVEYLLSYGRSKYKTLRLRTDTAEAAGFYKAIGFQEAVEPQATHRFAFA